MGGPSGKSIYLASLLSFIGSGPVIFSVRCLTELGSVDEAEENSSRRLQIIPLLSSWLDLIMFIRSTTASCRTELLGWFARSEIGVAVQRSSRIIVLRSIKVSLVRLMWWN